MRCTTIWRTTGVRQPERFGAFVNSVCNNVLLEYYRSLGKNQQMDETQEGIPSKVLDLEGMMVSKQCLERVREILSGLPVRDRELLRALFWEEKDRDTVCRDIGVDRNYLRVLLHRAKDKFKAAFESQDWLLAVSFRMKNSAMRCLKWPSRTGQSLPVEGPQAERRWQLVV